MRIGNIIIFLAHLISGLHIDVIEKCIKMYKKSI